MPIAEIDLKVYKSNNVNSDGGAIVSSLVVTNRIGKNGQFFVDAADESGDNNGTGAALFPTVTGDQAASGIDIYRKVYYRNEHATNTWQKVINWLTDQITILSADRVFIGIGVNNADDADGAQGNMTAWGASAVVALVSDGVDTRTATIIGEDASGDYQTENVNLNGATEVLSVNSYTKVKLVYVGALDAARTITIKQGTGGTTRGTIGPNKKVSFLFEQPTTKAGGLKVSDITVNGNFPLWMKVQIPGGAPAGTYDFTAKAEGDTVA